MSTKPAAGQFVQPEFFAELSAKWRRESAYCRHQIEALTHEEKSYLEEGIQIVDFVRNAHKLFEKQSPSEKRRLLNFLLSNCEWERGKLRACLRQPFDFLVKAVDHAKGDSLSKRKKNVRVKFGWGTWTEIQAFSTH